MTSCGRSGASSAISSVSSVSVAATSSSVSIEEMSDSRTGVGDLEQDLAVALGLDEVPDVEPLVERQRLEDVGDVGRMQPVELALQLRLVLPGDEALDELAAVRRPHRRVLELLVDEPFDEPVPAQQRRDLGERVLHALARLGAFAAPCRSTVSDMAEREQGQVRAVRDGAHSTPRRTAAERSADAAQGSSRRRHAREDDRRSCG